MISLPDELRELKRFHGHLGPYAVVGFRMGIIARSRYPDKIFSTAYSGTKRPLSCMADGIQMSSCCTLGKGNITLNEAGKASADFTDNVSAFNIELRPSVKDMIDTKTTHQNEELVSLDIYHMPDDVMFIISEIKKE